MNLFIATTTIATTKHATNYKKYQNTLVQNALVQNIFEMKIFRLMYIIFANQFYNLQLVNEINVTADCNTACDLIKHAQHLNDISSISNFFFTRETYIHGTSCTHGDPS